MGTGSSKGDFDWAQPFAFVQLPSALQFRLKRKRINPGNVEDIHKQFKEIKPAVFQGAKFILNNPITNEFNIKHTVTYCGKSPASYQVGTAYGACNEEVFSKNAYPTVYGEFDISGIFTGHIAHQLTPQLTMKCTTQINNIRRLSGLNVVTDYKGSDYTLGLVFHCHDFLKYPYTIGMQYLQSITRSLMLGAECCYTRDKNTSNLDWSTLSLNAKYSVPNYVSAATVTSCGALHLTHCKQTANHMQIGVELKTVEAFKNAVGCFVYQTHIKNTSSLFRGMFDTRWNLGGVWETNINSVHLPFSFAVLLSAIINHVTKDYKFGIGVSID